MAPRHGKNARLLVSLDGTAAASLVSYAANWTVNMTTDDVEVTSFGDSNKSYVAGLPDSSGSVSGFFDVTAAGTDVFRRAAADGIARGFYLYMDSTDLTKNYWYGSALWDFESSGAVDAAVAFSSNFKAAGAITFKAA